jgi:flagellar basal-body rod modification protein FlgD
MAIAAASGFNSQIGQQQFLNLLTAQLIHQNPLEPTSQEDFLGQLAQFSTLSGIEQLNYSFESMFKLQSLTQGATLVGKNVQYFSKSSGEKTTGIVEAASVEKGELVLTINGEKVGISDITSVLTSPSTDD